MHEHLEFALELAQAADKAIMPLFRSDLVVDTKADSSPVTQADRQAEEVMRGLIERRHPEHDILGEEGGSKGREGASHRWILDPIDGTVSFINGVPLFSTLIGLEVDGEPILGVVRFPALNEMVWAVRGKGCLFDGVPARVRECPALSDAVVSISGLSHTDVNYPDGAPDGTTCVAMGALIRKTKTFRGWSDAYGHILVATGRMDAMVDPEMAPWDTAALVPIIEEAGGKVTALDGKREGVVYAGSLVATAGGIHPEVLDVLAGASGGDERG